MSGERGASFVSMRLNFWKLDTLLVLSDIIFIGLYCYGVSQSLVCVGLRVWVLSFGSFGKVTHYVACHFRDW